MVRIYKILPSLLYKIMSFNMKILYLIECRQYKIFNYFIENRPTTNKYNNYFL